MKQGMQQLAEVPRSFQFKQCPWLETYITFNTEKRMNASSDTDKHVFKLANNSFFDQTMMNKTNHVNVEHVSTPKRFNKLCTNATKAHRIFNKDLADVH